MRTPDSAHLSPPRLVFRVGFTGHRPERLAETHVDYAALTARVREVLSVVRDAVMGLHEAREAPYADDVPVLRLVTSLAEGGDRVSACTARSLGFELQVVLPFRQDDYATDFAGHLALDGRASSDEFEELLRSATAVMELDADPRSPTRYVAAGLSVVRQCDLLLTIWDGRPERGPGGAGANVNEAVRMDVPIVWIDAQGPRHDMGIVRAQRTGLTRDAWDPGPLQTRVRELLLLAEQRTMHGAMSRHDEAPRHALAGFLGSNDDPSPLVPAYRATISAFASRAQPEALQEALGLSPELLRRPSDAASPESPALAEEVRSRVPAESWTESTATLVRLLASHFGNALRRADERAMRYASLYRNAMTWAYLAAALAVIFAAAGLFAATRHTSTSGESHGINWVAVLAGGEVLALAFIWRLYRHATTSHFHRRWLDSRSVAEKLRHAMALSALGSPSLGVRFPPTLDAADERSSWTNWYFRALVRQAGVLPLRLWVPEIRSACRTLVSWWLIRDQARYHFSTALRTGTAHARVQVARNVFFALTVVLAVVHFAAAFVEELPVVQSYGAALGLATVIFPVIATTLHTFSNQLDLENTTLRSAAALVRLRDAHERLEESRDPSSSELTQITISVSESLLGELVEWRGDVSVKPPLIP